MKMRQFILCISIVCFLPSCASNAVKMSASEVAEHVTVKNSDFDSTILYEGPRIKSKATLSFFESGWVDSWLRTVKDKNTGITAHGVYVVIDYTGNWRYYESASFSGGKTRKLKVLDRRVNSCSNGICNFTEQVLLSLSQGELNAGSKAGITFRINGKKIARNQGSEITIPADYVVGFISGTSG